MPATLNLTPDELLTTTRAVRKRLDFDRPVPLDLVRECIDVATQAPTGSNQQGWHCDGRHRRRQAQGARRDLPAGVQHLPQHAGLRGPHLDRRSRPDATQARVASSAEYLAELMARRAGARHPVHRGAGRQRPGLAQRQLLGLDASRRRGASALPPAPAGSARRGRPCTSCSRRRPPSVLGIPFDTVSQGALLPVAYTKGTDFKPGPRIDLDTIVHVDSW